MSSHIKLFAAGQARGFPSESDGRTISGQKQKSSVMTRGFKFPEVAPEDQPRLQEEKQKPGQETVGWKRFDWTMALPVAAMRSGRMWEISKKAEVP